MTTITALNTPQFPTSTNNVVLFATEANAPLVTAVPIYNQAGWQLFGGSALEQTTSNEAFYGMWIDYNS